MREIALSRKAAACLFCALVIARTAGAQLSADVSIDYGAEGHTVDPMAYGGNLHYQWNSSYRRDRDALAAIAGHSWRVHWWDNTSDGYRWDTHTIESDGGIYYWHKLDFEENSDGLSYVESPNSLEVAYWNEATDFSHSLALTKSAAAGNTYMSIRGMSQGLPFYVRFDLMIDGAVNYQATGDWYIAHARGESYNDDFRVRLTDEREISLIVYDAAQAATTLTSAPLTADAWHSVEVRYGVSDAVLWVDGSPAGTTAPLDLSGKNLTDLFIGAPGSDAAGVEGKIYLDAVRVSDSYVGSGVQAPWNDDLTATGRYAGYLTFDGNMMTVDDICRLAEEIGVTVIFQIPLSVDPSYGGQPGPPYSWDTIQYWADFVEYINGTADPDYASKSFDWSHSTPSDNWANLRAQRGRVSPYGLEYIEIGNEPYYQGWSWDPPASFAYYGQKWADTANAVKQADPAIRCGLPGREAWGLWDAALPAILARYPGEDLVDWLAVHQYSRILGQPDADQADWWLGAPVAARWEGRPDELAGQPWLNEPEQAYSAIDTYLSGQANYPSIFVGLTEYNYPINFPYGYYNDLIDAICKASFIGSALEKNVKMAHVFTLATEQGHTFGCIADTDSSVVGRQVTPSYYAFSLWGQHFGTALVSATVDGPSHLFDWSFGSNPTWETYRIPYLSLWASKNDAGDALCLMAINRHQTEPVTATISIANFTPESTAEVYTLGGSGYTIWSDNGADPQNVTIVPSQIGTASASFDYTFEPLSVTAIVLTGSTQISFPLKVSFQPHGSLIPPGFLPDSGDPFQTLGIHQYGWQ